MHEFGFCEPILDAVERRAAGRRVTRVRVRAGALLRVAEPALDQAFALVSAGTIAEGAAVDLVTVPARATCRACGHAEDAQQFVLSCAACGAPGIDLAGGEELLLESIEYAPT